MRVLGSWRFGLGAGWLLAAGLALAQTQPITPAPSPAASAAYPECTRQPTDADLEAAKGAHKAATQFYERAEYLRAIQYWKDAYAFDCTAHGVLINIANAYEKEANLPETVTALETYLARVPNAPDVATIQEKIRRLQEKMKPPPAPTASASASARPWVPPPPASSAPAQPPLYRPYGDNPWFVAGAGGVALIAGAILMPLGYSAISDAEAACNGGRQNCTQEVADQGNSGRVQVGIGAAALGLGVAGVAGGLIWQFALNQPRPAPEAEPAASPPTARVRVAPAVGPGYGGLGVSGRF